MIAGPAKTMSSVIDPLVIDFERNTYDCPIVVAGMIALSIPFISVAGWEVVSRPLTNTK